jgi:hypothetical protein
MARLRKSSQAAKTSALLYQTRVPEPEMDFPATTLQPQDPQDTKGFCFPWDHPPRFETLDSIETIARSHWSFAHAHRNAWNGRSMDRAIGEFVNLLLV